MIEVRRKEGESPASLLFRFTKRVRHSGIMPETRKRRFTDRPQNRQKRRLSAIFRSAKRARIVRQKKLGLA